MPYPRDSEELEAKIASPGDPREDLLLKHGISLTDAEYREIFGSPAHLDNRHPLHDSTVDRANQAAAVEVRPDSPVPLTDADGAPIEGAVAKVARTVAATAKRDGVEPTVKSLQMGMNERAADWDKSDPQRPGPLLSDGLYGAKTNAALRRHLALDGADAVIDGFRRNHLSTTGELPVSGDRSPGAFGPIRKAGERGLGRTAPVLRSDDPGQPRMEKAFLPLAVWGGYEATMLVLGLAGAAGVKFMTDEAMRQGQSLKGPDPTNPIQPKPYDGADPAALAGIRKEAGRPLIRIIHADDLPKNTSFPIPDEPNALVEIFVPAPKLTIQDTALKRYETDDTRREIDKLRDWALETAAKLGIRLTHEGGGRENGVDKKESWHRGLDEQGNSYRTRKNGVHPDLTFLDEKTGRRYFINHHDINADGSPTDREATSGLRIIANTKSGDIGHLFGKLHQGAKWDEGKIKAMMEEALKEISSDYKPERPFQRFSRYDLR